jgi:arylsulfatase A-like enzyme
LPQYSIRRLLCVVANVALIVGLLDAAAVRFDFLRARGLQAAVPASTWIVFPILWLIVLILFLAPFLVIRNESIRSRLVLIVLFVAGPALLTVLRVVYPLRMRMEYRGRLTLMLAILVSIGFCLVAMKWTSTVMARFSTPAGALVIALMSCLLLLTQAKRPRPASASAGQALPNIVLIFLDTHRYDHSGGPGELVNLPNLEQLNREGTAFENAYVPSPWTMPSHVSTLTGLAPEQHGVTFDQLRYLRTDPTLAERLSRRGYATAAVFSNGLLSSGSGLDRGFQVFENSEEAAGVCRFSPGLIVAHYSTVFRARVCRYPAEAVTSRAVEALNDLKQPYFLALNYMDAHDPYYADPDCRSPGTGVFHAVDDAALLNKVNSTGVPLPDSELNRLRGLYRAAIHCEDKSLGKLFAAIRSRPDADRTITIAVGDHAEQFGEHQFTLHGNSLYRQVLRVPLIIHGGPFATGGRRTKAVSTTRLYPFLLAVSSGEPIPETMLEMLETPYVVSLHQPSGGTRLRRRMREYAWSVIEHPHHLIYRESGGTELFNYEQDPEEIRNLSRDAPSADVMSRLMAEVRKLPSLTQLRQHDERDAKFRSLGYLQ